ncbi:unnamed protein product [Darwinula stevensoni]|uniref:E3 ubiquitin-protein ligase synoviolin-like TPR repeats domain-containing protein n=1 Tax=Darwinula stevensoni TaxID=69355 RepID=A0A7R9ACF7_9CRUS|nr:unnamed protein product [Darwinula stevensoni]CAG0900152.1 unnamed protein product [Darwinula stevensoni]
MKMRAAFIALASLGLTAIVIGNAYYQKSQFYPSVVYITKSNPSMAVIYVQAFVIVILLGKLMRKLFFGQLRAVEFEHLMERSWYAVTETCLAFTVFRDDFSPKFVALFTLLLFLKSFHWLAEDRVDYMERSPVITFLFHARVVALLLVLIAADMTFITHSYYSTITKGPSVQLVFGFEYAILLTIALSTSLKYILHTSDMQNENTWENKAVFLLYLELIMGFIKVVLYTVFVMIMVKIHTFPLFAIRPMYLTARSFKRALHDVVMSRRAIRNMNTLYPDATPEDLAQTDNTCIICREDMSSGGNYPSSEAWMRFRFPQPGSTGFQLPFAGLPPFPPPFPFMAPPPPPLPPEGFQGLGDEELRAMEGLERENVEARIRCLRNISTLLDAAVLQMQQYHSIVAPTMTGLRSVLSALVPVIDTSASKKKGSYFREKSEEEKRREKELEEAEERELMEAFMQAPNADPRLEEIRRRRLRRFHLGRQDQED